MNDTEACAPKPGRFRRWILRPLMWTLALLVVFFGLLQIILDTAPVKRWMTAQVAQTMSANLGVPVDLREVSIQLVPLTVEIWGLKIGAPPGLPRDQHFLYLPWGSVELDVTSLDQNELRIREIRLERPQVFFAFFPQGKTNLFKIKRNGEPAGERRFDVLVDHIEMDKAEIYFDQDAVRLSISGDDARARLEGLGHLHLAGQLVVPSVVVRMPRAKAPLNLSVAVRGSVQGKKLELEEARINGQYLDLRTTGSCDWPNQEDRRCTLDINTDTRGEILKELGYFSSLQGQIRFDGLFEWRPKAVGLRGTVTSPLLVLWKRRLENFEGYLVSDRYSSRVAIRHADYGDGTLDGSYEVEGGRPGHPSNVDINFRGVKLNTLLADQKIKTGDFAARVNARLNYRFPINRGRKGDGFAEIHLFEAPELEGLPLAGNFPARVEDGIITAESLVVFSDTQSVFSTGWYDLQRQRGLFNYEIASADIVPLAHVLRLAKKDEPWPEWLPTAGEGKIVGELQLIDNTTITTVDLDLEKVLGLSVTTPQEMVGTFRVEPNGVEDIRLQLADGRSALLMQGRVPLKEELPDGLPNEYNLMFSSFSWPLESVHPWLDFELDIDGRISGEMDFTTRGESSFGRLSASVEEATVRGIPVKEVASRFSWDNESLYFDELRFLADAGQVTGSGRLTFANDGVDMTFQSQALELGAQPLQSYLPRPDLAGKVELDATLAGTLSEPEVELNVEAPEVSLGERILTGRSSTFKIDWRGGFIHVAGRLLDMVTLEGGGLFETERSDVTIALDGHDLAGLLEVFLEQPPDDVDGTFGGSVKMIQEPSEDPRVDLLLERLAFNFKDRELQSVEPVELRLFPNRMEIGSLYLAEPSTTSELFMTGDIGYGEDGEVDLFVESTLDNSWYRFYQPDVRVEGFFDLLARVRGTQSSWYLDGQGEVRDGRIVLEKAPDFPHYFENFRGLLQFDPDGLVIDQMRADLAGGEIRMSGRTAPMRFGEPLAYRFAIEGNDLRVRYPVGFLLAGDMSLALRTLDPEEGENNSGAAYLLDGSAEMKELEYNEDIPVGFVDLLEGMLLRQRLEVNPADQLFSLIQLNVDVVAPEALRVRNNLADLSGSADLLLRGNVAQPVFLGELELSPGGKIVYSGTDYQIERGRLGFSNAFRLNPEVDLVASTRLRDFEVTLNLSGTADRLNAGFTSDPPLPALEVFELLATGGEQHTLANTVRRADELGDEQSMSAASFLYGQAASAIGDRVSNLFGFDKFRIDPLTGSGDNLSKARVTVGKRLAKDVFVSYSVDPSSTEEHRLQLEWQIGRSLVLVLTQNGDNTYEADARWETSF